MINKMNEIHKSKAAQILGCYSNSEELLEKGGKKAFIGEVRTYSGQKWVKHQDGWVHVSEKGGKHILERPGGKREEANEFHVAHAITHLTGKDTKEDSSVSRETVKKLDLNTLGDKLVTLNDYKSTKSLRIKTEQEQLKKLSKRELLERVKQSYQVYDGKDSSKEDIISDILTAKFGGGWSQI